MLENEDCRGGRKAVEGVETPERAMKQKHCTKVQLYEAAPNNIALLIVLAIK